MPTRKTGSPGKPPEQPAEQPAEDDLALWRHVTRDARPLAKRPAAPRPETQAPVDKKPSPTAASKPKPPAKQKDAPHPPTPPPKAPELAKRAVVGVDKRTAGRMKRGKLPVEGRLDLHGLTQNEAERALAAFLVRSQERGHRCVLVITGKGGGERRGEDFSKTGVLRRMVPLWLNQPANRARILAFDEARAQHGGAGALYVLLRRARTD